MGNVLQPEDSPDELRRHEKVKQSDRDALQAR